MDMWEHNLDIYAGYAVVGVDALDECPSPAQIEAFRREFAEVLAHPRNRCIDLSMMFLAFLGVPDREMHCFMTSNRDHGPDEFQEHHWLRFGHLHIDWSAHQYDANAPVPLMWVGEGHPLEQAILRSAGTDEHE